MNENTRELHLYVGKKYGREATCGPKDKPKVNYKEFDQARESALVLSKKFEKAMEPYPCYWCGGWHIGRALTIEEIKRFLKEMNAMTDR